MNIQGWGIKNAIQQTTFLSRSSGKKNSKTMSVSEKPDTVNASTESDSIQRLELLQKVRERIQNGFYNSDAVVDDLGFGFAQALDQTL